MFANKIIIWAFKQSPEVHNAVLVYKYLMQMEKMDLGTLDNLLGFFKEEKIISAQVTLFICKQHKIMKEEKSYAFLPFYKIY